MAGFSETPSNMSVLLGHDVTFRCAADKSSTNSELYSQWRSNTGALLGFHDVGQLTGHQGRYSYLKYSQEELHLRIERVTLEDDGQFECQMLRPDEGPIRAAAYLNVIVAPKAVYFANYQSGSVIDVNEDIPLNVTCVTPNAKPEATLVWYINGRKIDEGIQRWSSYNLNKTVSSFAALQFRPRRNDHKKVLTCEANHEDSSTQIRTNITLNILYPPDRPKVSILNGDSFVRAGDNVTFVCTVSGGNPPPDLSWYLKDRLLSARYQYDLQTQKTINTYSFLAEPEDHLADYECRTSNSRVREPQTRTIHVRVAYAPQDVEMLGESNIRQGSFTVIQCRTKPSNPVSRISWLVNGHPVPTTIQSEYQEPHGFIAISNLTVNTNDVLMTKHRLTVDCNARNDEGSASKQHVIKILAPPMPPRISGLEEGIHLEGLLLNVTCEAHGGNPLADISWYRGYDKLPGARSSVSGDSAISSLSLTLDRTMNGQRLKCEAMNSALDEPMVDSKQLNVLFLPRRVMIRMPEGTRHQLLAGEETKLHCLAAGSNPHAEITWYFYPNGEPNPIIFTGETILNETSRDSGHTIQNAVTFIPTEEYDGTLVRCIASNPLWPTTKNATYPLNVLYPPRLIVNSPISIVVAESDSFRENMTVRGNPPVSAWRWRKNGVPFDHTIGNVFARGATLSGRNVKSSDAGMYTLFAVNSVGTANVTIQLIVEYSARITRISSPIIASEGEAVLLECEADGVPRKPDMVRWMRNGIEIPSTKRSETHVNLRLNATKETSGQYVCHADNGIGFPGEGTAYVLVNTAPRIMTLPLHSRAAGPLGGRARARCRAHAVPDVDFVWDRAGDIIQGNNSKYTMSTIQLDYSTFESTLMISNLSPDDYAREVSCTARNSFGTDSIQIPIGPPSPPDAPLDVHVTNITSNTLSISWTPGFDGGSDQTFEVRYQKYGEEIVHGLNTSHSSLRLSGLAPSSIYLFQLRSINSRGFSSELTRPPAAFSTLNEDGSDVAVMTGRADSIPRPVILLLAIGGTLLLLFNCLLLCYLQRRNKKKKIQEKTEMVRTAINGEGVRPVQMYGTMLQAEGTVHCTRDERDVPEASEDDHSVRTMIEVNPNGYMQQIDPSLYERNCLVEYEFDPRDYPGNRHGTIGKSGTTVTYTNMPYPVSCAY
ncbi:immunoglobulin domain protein [Dictyocaulus viviparus]|uniref:Immunoglobulin domain protein n=1 Tax=Dictyocaulus viviparus TaxID=29172 RepID=A0A0D8X7M2_DICVI|nr:immunoglobulin domain protein [Dictyocaulus viviparus]